MLAALEDAFLSTTHRRFFCQLARALNDPKLTCWLDKKGDIVEWQIRERLEPRSNGVIERELREVKRAIYDRRTVFRNKHRTDRLLQLMTLERRGLADEDEYARLIREHLTTTGGLAEGRHTILDRAGRPSLR